MESKLSTLGFVLILTAMIVSGCRPTTPQPTSVLPTPAPTYTPYPTHTPYPTPTPLSETIPTPHLPTPTSVPTTKPIEQGILWTQQLLIPPYPSEEPRDAFFVQEDKVFLTNPEGYIAAFDLATGEQLWQWEDKGTVYGTEAGTVYVVRDDQRLYALDATTGQQKWKTIFGVDQGSYRVDWPLWISQDTVHLPFFASGVLSGYVFATVDKRTGNVLWWTQDFSKIVAVTDRTLMVSEGAGYIYWRGLDPVTGAERWKAGTRLPYATAEVSEGDFFYLVPKEGWVEGISQPEPSLVSAKIDSGNMSWQSERANIEIIAITQNAVYASYREGVFSPSNLTIINRQTGKELWTWASGESFVGEFEGTAILSDLTRLLQ